MVRMPTEVIETLRKQKPTPIATSSLQGVPNVVYVGSIKILDDENIMIADNFFNKTLRNLEENPRISILCWDAENKRSYQIKGSVKVHISGAKFDEMRAWIHSTRPELPAKSCVMVEVEEVYNAKSGPEAGKRIV